MQLISCHIVNFGCLSDRSYHFKDGLNLLLAENGSGKSTLTVFIKAILFGLPATTKRDITENERKRYKPWNGGVYGGSLEFEANGKSYRAERFFGTKEREDRFTLIHLATQKESDDFSENLGEELFGVDADGFERSLYLSQRYPYLSPENNSIRQKLGSLFAVSDDLGDFEKADGILDRVRKIYQTTGDRGKIGDLTRSSSQIAEEIRRAEDADAASAEQKKRLAAAEQKKKELLAENETLRTVRAAAEKRRLLEEQRASFRRLTEGIENEKSILSPLNQFFNNHLPTEEELADAELALQKAEEIEAKLSVSSFSEEDRVQLEEMRSRYGDIPPTVTQTDAIHEKLSLLREAKSALEQSTPKEDSEWQALEKRFEGNLPTDQEIEAMHAATEAYDNAEADFLIAEQEKKSRIPIPSIVLAALSVPCAIFLLIAILLTIGGVFHAPASTLSIFLGACAVLVCLCLAFLSFVLSPKPKNAALQVMQEKQEALLSMVAPYVDYEKNPSVAAKLLFKDIARFRTLKAQRVAMQEAHKAAASSCLAAEQALQSALAHYGIAERGEAGVLRFEKEAALYARLYNAAANAMRYESLLHQSLQSERGTVSAFLASYPELASFPPRDALATVRQKLLLYRDSLLRYEEGKHKLALFLKESAFDPSAPLPPFVGESEELARKEKELTESLLLLEKEIASQNAAIERYSELAARAPHLRAQRQAVEEEKKDAEHTLFLIQSTRKFLSDAKEDLSTRYLGDMEAHFKHYLSLLSAKDENFRFNTDLALSAEKSGERRSVEVLSRGEQDLIAFCARIALIEAIFSEQRPFLVLDDPFVNLDDKNYARAVALLGTLASRFQILYTVCSEARVPH